MATIKVCDQCEKELGRDKFAAVPIQLAFLMPLNGQYRFDLCSQQCALDILERHRVWYETQVELIKIAPAWRRFVAEFTG